MKRQDLHELMIYFETDAIDVAIKEMADTLKEAERDWGKGYKKKRWHRKMAATLKELRSIAKGRREMLGITREDA